MFAVRRTLIAAPRLALAPRATFVSTAYRSDIADSVKDAANKVNKAVGDAVLGGINAGENLTDKAAKVTENLKEQAAPAVEKAQEVSNPDLVGLTQF